MSKTRILIADDHAMFRQGIRAVLSGEADMEIVGEASNAAEAVEKASELRPDIVLMDIDMTGMCSFEATRIIRRNRPEARVIMLTMHSHEEYLAQCMEVGGGGYVLKEAACSQLVLAIRDVARGGSYLSPRMLTRLVEDFRSRLNKTTSGITSRMTSLTPREREVMKFLAEGNSVKEIAETLSLSVKTVEAHKFNLMRKLDIHNRSQLIQYAIQKRIINVQPIG